MKLFQDSGSTPEQRKTEADRLIKMIAPFEQDLSPVEQDLINRIRGGIEVTTKRLFWLRDIKDRLL